RRLARSLRPRHGEGGARRRLPAQRGLTVGYFSLPHAMPTLTVPPTSPGLNSSPVELEKGFCSQFAVPNEPNSSAETRRCWPSAKVAPGPTHALKPVYLRDPVMEASTEPKAQLAPTNA